MKGKRLLKALGKAPCAPVSGNSELPHERVRVEGGNPHKGKRREFQESIVFPGVSSPRNTAPYLHDPELCAHVRQEPGEQQSKSDPKQRGSWGTKRVEVKL